ncbi:thiaminase II [Pelagibius sp. Alg239-R121]|uniref:thiaminase II n=1 Tax=Pelagibius sp. Alg239-R121 TaxID=2993448 RepID=UPI0024A705B3|nr:thiaminase II [Pelagibius sp. Alg239-R121]
MSDFTPAWEQGVFAALKSENRADWEAYVDHEFVRRLGDGTLPEACFRHYLVQDYLFLIHFSRAYALAVYKSDNLDDMRKAAATMEALLNEEMQLHLRYCEQWGLNEADMARVDEASENLAYTRFVLDAGLSGDLLDLLTALAPCVAGYGEIGLRLGARSSEDLSGNPYRDWIETYAGDGYQSVVEASLQQLDQVATVRAGDDIRQSGRWKSLSKTFGAATRLEVGFWNMGMSPNSTG